MYNKIKQFRLALYIVLAVGLGIIFMNSDTQAASTYRIRINKQQNCVTIYKANEKGKYEPYKAMVCSVGSATPLGTFPLKEKIRWHELDGPVYGQYCTRITGHILFHSVWYYENNNPASLSCTQYNKLGQVASHGCVRLCVRDAKWIYNNVPSGTPVEIYNSKDPGPLGKPEAIKLSGYWGWDPTDDTNPANPYNNKKPSITLKKGNSGNTNIGFASNFNILKTITAKNTTGFDVSKRVTYTVKYKKDKKAKAKKVKKVNTGRAGIYLVKFKVTDEIGRKASLSVKYNVLGQVFIKSFKLNRTSKSLYLGGNAGDSSFKLKMKSYAPSKASIKELKFTSSNTNVATVDAKGKVKAVGPGSAVISAKTKDGSNIKQYCTVNVGKYAGSVTASVDQAVLTKGQQTIIRTSLLPAGATGKSNLSYSFASSNPAVVSVDASGNVTALGEGSAEIIVTASNAAKSGNLVTRVFVTVNAAQGSDASPSALTLN